MADAQYGSADRQAESQAVTICVLCVVFSSLACVSVILRIYTRRMILHTFGPDDVAISIAQFLSFGVMITTALEVAIGGLGRHMKFLSHETYVAGTKGFYANLLIYNAAQLVTKISFLIQYRRLFPGVVIQKLCAYGMGFLAVWGVSQQLITAFSCVPLRLLAPGWQGRCINTILVFNLNTSMNVATDFVIFLIPIWPVLHLQIPRRRKIHLLVVFCLGFFACAISIIRFHELIRTGRSSDASWDGSATAYWSVIELNVGILCACLPTLRPLVKKFAPQLHGSSNATGDFVLSHQLSVIHTRRSTKIPESGIYIQKEVEFGSTTQLRSNEATKDPFSVHGESFRDVIGEGSQATRIHTERV